MRTLEKTVYDTREVASLLGMSIQQVYRLVRENKIPHKRVGERKILFPKKMFKEWLNEVEVDNL